MNAGRRGDAPSPDERAARERWSRAHGDVDPDSSIWISGWLSIVHRLTRPLAGRQIPPGLVTSAGLAASALVPLFAWLGGGWPLVAAGWAVVAALLDGVDGALARWDDSATPWGSVVDDLADRCSDVLMLVALVLLGAPAAVCALAAVLTLLLESARASARAAGLRGVGALTVWERPSRVIVAVLATGICGIAGLAGSSWPAADDAVEWVAYGAGVLAAVLAAAGLLHLLLVLRRLLSGADVSSDRRAR